MKRYWKIWASTLIVVLAVITLLLWSPQSVYTWVLLGKAELGDVQAQKAIGTRYYHQKNYSQAAKWYQKVANQGDREIPGVLAGMYEFGKGVKQDYTKAFNLYHQGAESGDPLDVIKTADFYQKGLGVKQNYAEAVKWYRKAAEHRYGFSTMAQHDLGRMYELGQGVKQDYAEAYFWYLLSGDISSFKAQDHLTEAQIKEVRHRAEEWDFPESKARLTVQPNRPPSQTMPKSAAAALISADRAILFSLSPDSGGSYKGPGAFHGWETLGHVSLKGSQAALVAGEFLHVIDRGIPDNIPLCFNPRHGLRVVTEGHTFDFVLCYECGQLYVYEDDKSIASFAARGDPHLLNGILIHANIPLRKLPQ